MKVWNKIYFKREKRPYKIMAMNDRYIICTKPFNLKHTFLYTIVDLKEQVRWPCDLVFWYFWNCEDYKDKKLVQKDCEEMLKDLISWEIEVSHRHRINLDLLNT